MTRVKNDDLFHNAIQKYWEGAFDESITLLEELIIKTYREGDHLEFRSRANLCEAYMRVGKYVDAMECATNLIARAEEESKSTPRMHEFRGEGIGSLLMALEKIDLRSRWLELKPLLIEALDIARQYDYGTNNYWVVQNQETLGICAARMGEFEEALTWLQGALNTIREGTPEPDFFRSRIFQHLSTLARLRGDLEESIRYGQLGIEVAEKNRDYSAQLETMARLTLAEAEYAYGRKKIALEMVRAILSRTRFKKWYVEEQRTEYLLSELEQEIGDLEKAKEAVDKALSLAVKMGMKEEEVRCLLSRGKAAAKLEQKKEALQDFEKAKRLSQERNYEDHFNRAETQIELTKTQ